MIDSILAVVCLCALAGAAWFAVWAAVLVPISNARGRLFVVEYHIRSLERALALPDHVRVHKKPGESWSIFLERLDELEQGP